MKIYLYFICLFFFLRTSGISQPVELELTPANPATVGISSDRLNRLDNFIQSYVDKEWFPGGVFLVARKGKIVYQKDFGFHTKEKKVPYKEDDIFRIASMTKAVTTVAVMQLYEQGKLGLDDPIFYYIPAFKEPRVLDTFNEADSSFTTVPAKKPITIRHLLTHTSGFTYGVFHPGKIQIVYEKYHMNDVGLSHDQWSNKEYMDRLAEVPLIFQPGERFMYGLNMDVLGRIIEVVSGLSLSDYFRQNIFEPLGMEDTYFYLPKEKQDRLVPLYTQTRDRGLQMAAEVQEDASRFDYPKKPDHPHYSGGGGLSSTAMDFARFIQALVNGGSYKGQRILGRKTIEVMTSDQLITLNAEGKGFSKLPGLTFGLGFALLTDQGDGLNSKSPGTYEWGGYFHTRFFIDPKEKLIFVGMGQIVPLLHPEFWQRLYTIIYSSLED